MQIDVEAWRLSRSSNDTERVTEATLTFVALAEAARQSGKPVAYVNAPKADYAAFLVKVGLPAPVAEVLASVEAEAIPVGLLDTDSQDLSNLIGRPMTPISETVTAALKINHAS